MGLAPTKDDKGLCEGAKGGENGRCAAPKDSPAGPLETFATPPALPLFFTCVIGNEIGCLALEPVGVGL